MVFLFFHNFFVSTYHPFYLQPVDWHHTYLISHPVFTAVDIAATSYHALSCVLCGKVYGANNMRSHILHQHGRRVDQTEFEKAVLETGVLPQGLPTRPTEVCQRPIAGLLLLEAQRCEECGWLGQAGMRNHYTKHHPGVKKPAKLETCPAQRYYPASPFFEVAHAAPVAEDRQMDLLEEHVQRAKFAVEESRMPTDVRNMTPWAKYTGWMRVVDSKDVERLLATVEPLGKLHIVACMFGLIYCNS